MYHVGNQTFPDIQSARAYDYENSGTIDNVRAGPAEGFDGTYHDGTVNVAYVQQQEENADPAEQNRTYTYVRESRDLDGGESRHLWNAYTVKTAEGHAGLRELYADRKEYAQLFGNVDNFITYMDSMYDLQQSEPELYNWWETFTIEEYIVDRYPNDFAMLDMY